ncbi:MAG TPA: uracil-DNA glycosylase [Acidimicrobiia bacterium]|nr:uracil-DNA glycosylase [Acidimicrobiia bacterium]
MTELQQLRVTAESCTMCRLSQTRTQVVFGVGEPDSQLMFVGEAPGRNEDLQGVPFVGRAGRLLDGLLDEVGIPRDTVYIANVLKCRPPNNRDPQPDEIDACKGYLRQQIRLIRPSVVVTLGNFATKLLLNTTTGITRLRGQAFPWWLGATLIPTFHPAAALRGGEKVTQAMREDFQLMRETLDVAAQPEPPRVEDEPTSQAKLWN